MYQSTVADKGFPGGGANSRRRCANLLLPPANEVCEGYVFTGVFLSTGRVSTSGPEGCLPPPGQTPPPWADTTPCADTPLPCPVHAGIVNKRAVRIPLECILVLQNVRQKLHENERIWTGGSLAPPASATDPLLQHKYSESLVCK